MDTELSDIKTEALQNEFIGRYTTPHLKFIEFAWGWCTPPLRLTPRELQDIFEAYAVDGLFCHPLFTLSYERVWAHAWDYCDRFEVVLRSQQHRKPKVFGPYKNQDLALQKLHQYLIENKVVEVIPARCEKEEAIVYEEPGPQPPPEGMTVPKSCDWCGRRISQRTGFWYGREFMHPSCTESACEVARICANDFS